MYASQYNKLFWGMIFIIFNVNLGSINILPNFIGYILIYSGLSVLVSQHEIYNKGKSLSVILAILTFKNIVNLGNDNLLTGQFQGINLWIMAVDAVASIINIYLIYIICKGIYLLSEDRRLEELNESVQCRFKFYFSITILQIFYVPFSINIPKEYNIIIVFLAIVNIIASITIAALFKKARVQLEE